jgi:hypothetical protein
MDLRNAPRMHAIKERRSHSKCQQGQGSHFDAVQTGSNGPLRFKKKIKKCQK